MSAQSALVLVFCLTDRSIFAISFRKDVLIKLHDHRVSYRDLLGTAETVIQMDAEMHRVEAYMGDIGQRCNTRILERKGTNAVAWEEEIHSLGALSRRMINGLDADAPSKTKAGELLHPNLLYSERAPML